MDAAPLVSLCQNRGGGIIQSLTGLLFLNFY